MLALVRSGGLVVQVEVTESDEPFLREIDLYRIPSGISSGDVDGHLAVTAVSSHSDEFWPRRVLASQNNSNHYLIQVASGRVRCFNKLFNSLTTFCNPSQTPASPVKLELVQLFLTLLLNRQGLVLHASGVVHGDKALLTVGPCGAGKSTLARIMGGQLLSDDLVTVTNVLLQPIAHSTTFGGATDGEASFPLGAILFPTRAGSFRLRRLPPREAILRFKAENWSYLSHVPPPLMSALFGILVGLFGTVPAFEVGFSLDDFRMSELMEDVEGASRNLRQGQTGVA